MNISVDSSEQMNANTNNNIVYPAGHIAYSSCPIIRDICAPLLENYGINHFRYIRINADGSIATLTTSDRWQDRLLQADYVRYLNSSELWALKGTSYYLWDSIENEQLKAVLEDARDNFDIANGLVIIKRYDEYCECYCFATSKANREINNVYMEDKVVFERFILYFKDKAESLIREANEQPVFLPNSPFAKTNCGLDKSLFNNDFNKLQFISDTPIRNVQLAGEFAHIILTIGEAHCMYLLLKKMAFKQIARILHISPRTVEARLNKVRKKLNCKNKFELVSLVESTNILNTLEVSFYELKLEEDNK